MDCSRWKSGCPRSADSSDHQHHHRSRKNAYQLMTSSYRRQHKHSGRLYSAVVVDQNHCHKRDGGEIPKSLNYFEIAQQQKYSELGIHRSRKKARLPEEIIEEILVRLPSVKSVIKCSAVCKSWRCLIKSSTFIDAHLSRNQNQNKNDDDVGSLLLLRRSNDNAFLFYWHKPAASAFGFGGEYSIINNTNVKFITPFTYKSPSQRDEVSSSSRYFNLVGACNGLICLANDLGFLRAPTIIWNPSVRKFVALPSPSITVPPIRDYIMGANILVETSGFGYDSKTNDYKVLRILSSISCGGSAGDTPFGVEVYSLARGSWKTLSPVAAAFPGCFRLAQKHSDPLRHVFVSDALHWLVPRHRNWEECLIVSFDMVTESFGEIKMPEALRNPPGCYPIISIYQDSLALIDIELEMDRRLGITSYALDLWVMQQYGAVESWTKLCSVTLHNKESCPFPYAFKSSGEQVFTMRTDSGTHLLMVDFKTKQVKYSGVDDGSDYLSMDSFVESLVLLDQSNAISY